MSWFNKKKEEANPNTTLPELPDLPSANTNFPTGGYPDASFLKKQEDNFPEIQVEPLPILPSYQNPEPVKQTINPGIDNQEMQRSSFNPLPPPKEFEPRAFERPITPPVTPIISPVITKSPISPQQPRSFQPEFKSRPLPPPPQQPRNYQEIPEYKGRRTEPIYVRLDKFETTIQSLGEIKDKIVEIERILAKTKEVKAQEERELEEWEKEVHIIKTRLDSIDKNVFKELD